MAARLLKRRASNGLPWSVVICWGQPKRATQIETKALATASAVISERGCASGQRVYLSMAVRQYRKPEETGSGPYKVLHRNEKTYSIEVHGAVTTVSIDRLKPAYILHVDNSASPPAIPSIVTTRSGRRVSFRIAWGAAVSVGWWCSKHHRLASATA
jgi:hypothetical protein